MVGVKVEHVLILLIAAFVIYHLVGRCGCANGLDGFSVGSQETCEGKCLIGDYFKYKNDVCESISEKDCNNIWFEFTNPNDKLSSYFCSWNTENKCVPERASNTNNCSRDLCYKMNKDPISINAG